MFDFMSQRDAHRIIELPVLLRMSLWNALSQSILFPTPLDKGNKGSGNEIVFFYTYSHGLREGAWLLIGARKGPPSPHLHFTPPSLPLLSTSP